MSKPTNLKDALAKWEERNKQPASTATEIGLQFQYHRENGSDPQLADRMPETQLVLQYD